MPHLIHSLQGGFFSTIWVSVSVYLTMGLIFITGVHNVERIIANNGVEKQDRKSAYDVTLRRFRKSSGKAVSITYSDCVFVALGIQHAIRMRLIVICALSGSTMFFHIFHTI